jgi:hypothetical protein
MRHRLDHKRKIRWEHQWQHLGSDTLILGKGWGIIRLLTALEVIQTQTKTMLRISTTRESLVQNPSIPITSGM